LSGPVSRRGGRAGWLPPEGATTDPRGMVVYWMEPDTARDLAHMYGSHDGAYTELMKAADIAERAWEVDDDLG